MIFRQYSLGMSEKLREVIFDTETTGLKASDGDRVIEIGAVEFVNRYPTGKVFHYQINPEGKQVHADALKVHGISNEVLADKPKFADIVEEFLEFFAEGNLVAHNASFDTGFLNAELKRLGKDPLPQDRIVDTLQIARQKHPVGPNSLDALCSRYGIDNSRREKHGALLDSELLAEVYIELLGGRQASFSLEHDTGEDTQAADSTGAEELQAIGKRPAPLPDRLSEEDLLKHEKFIDSLGDGAIWKRVG